MIVTRVTFLINDLCGSKICEGNSDQEYLKLPNIHNNVLMNHSSKLIASMKLLQYLYAHVNIYLP